MTQWFGTSWGSALNDVSSHRATPIGAACERCHYFITMRDQGVILDGNRPDRATVFHLNCFLKSIIPHDQWRFYKLVPEAYDGFDMLYEGNVARCDCCGITYDFATGMWH